MWLEIQLSGCKNADVRTARL